MKSLHLFILMSVSFSGVSLAQVQNIHPVKYIFDPRVNSREDINDAISTAGREHKHVLLLVGGDWNYWSRQLYAIVKDTPISPVMNDKYVLSLVNFSPTNRNEDILSAYNCPRNLGYPIMIVLDEKGRKVHAQSTDEFKASLKWYDNKRVRDSLQSWARLSGKD